MAPHENEDRLLHSVALETARSIFALRRRTEEELLRQAQLLRVTLSSIGDGVISIDGEGLVTYMNPVAEMLTGRGFAESSGRPIEEVFHIIDEVTREPVPNPALLALRGGTTVQVTKQTVLIGRDGTARPIDDSASPMRSETGSAIGVVLVFRDVTENRHAEEIRARLAAIVETSDDAIVSKTLDGIIQSWNAGAERLFGYSDSEAIGKSITLIIPLQRHGEERNILARLCRGERIEHFETVRVAKDGHKLDISLTVSPIRDKDGRVIGASKIAQDITDRKHAETALKESQSRYRKAAAEAAQAAEANAKFRVFFEQGTNFAAVLSLDGTVTEANRLCLDLCGFTRDDVIGMPFWKCGWWNRSSEVMETIRTAVSQAAGGLLTRTETEYFVASGAKREVDLILAPVTDESGRILFVAATGNDVTDRRRMEQQLREQDRRKDEFLALLAHELRNPLAPLRNGLHVIRLSKDDPGIVSQTRGMMERQLAHMIRLVDDLLDVSRINRDKLQLRRSRILLADVIRTAVETSRPAFEAGGHELSISLPPEQIWLDADLTRLSQVFGNLLTNSAKYTPRGGRIWLTAVSRVDLVSVSVRDNGIGIPVESLLSVFDMFSQVDHGIERSNSGLGIGLAVVKRLVEMHGGTVLAQSEGLGKGSTFTVELPILGSRTQKIESERSAGWRGPQGHGRRILVVDDNQDSAISLSNVLCMLGNDTRTAHDGLEAVKLTKNFQPHVILMDVGMPRLNGYEATRRIRDEPWGQRPIIIALTGWGQEVDRARSKAAGCNGHLVKPVEIEDIEKLLSTLAEKRQAE